MRDFRLPNWYNYSNSFIINRNISSRLVYYVNKTINLALFFAIVLGLLFSILSNTHDTCTLSRLAVMGIGKGIQEFHFLRSPFRFARYPTKFLRDSQMKPNSSAILSILTTSAFCRSVDTEVPAIVLSRTNLVITNSGSFKNTLENSGGSIITINSNIIIYYRRILTLLRGSAQLLFDHVTSQKPRPQPLYVASLINLIFTPQVTQAYDLSGTTDIAIVNEFGLQMHL